MKELVDYIVKSFIGEESYEIVLVEDGDKVDIRVSVDKDKIAKVIGKGGKIAKAIRTLVRSASRGSDQVYNVYFEER